MKVQSISNQNCKPQFTSKVIVTPNTMTRLSHFMQDNPPVAGSILEGLKALEKNGNKDVVMIETNQEDSGVFVLSVFEKLKNKVVRSEVSSVIDFNLYTFKANVQHAYEKAKSNLVDVNKLNLAGFEVFNPLK